MRHPLKSRLIRWAWLAGLLQACAARQGAKVAPPGEARRSPDAQKGSKPSEGEAAAPPKWDNPAAVRHIWPQGTGLAEAGVLCPFVYPREDDPARFVTATYESGGAHRGPFSLHVAFRSAPGAPGGFGVGCLRRYDASRYGYVSFWIKGPPGLRYQFKLKDMAELEAIVNERVKEAGWHRVTIPTGDFAGIDLRALKTFSVGIDGASGEADLYLEGFEFTDQ